MMIGVNRHQSHSSTGYSRMMLHTQCDINLISVRYRGTFAPNLVSLASIIAKISAFKQMDRQTDGETGRQTDEDTDRQIHSNNTEVIQFTLYKRNKCLKISRILIFYTICISSLYLYIQLIIHIYI